MYNMENEFRYRGYTGIKKGLIICGNSDEVKITQMFSEFFAVTFSKRGRFKTTDYTIDFLQPSQELREYYNLYNEVLLLFSPYTVFENRTMDFVDKTLEEYGNRLDKVSIFIVSKDRYIDSAIRSLNSENKDTRIIVPFTYDEILSGMLNKNYLNSKLRKYFYNRDLFALESPLKTEAYFFGRGKTVQFLYDKYMIGEQSGLFGLRKIGKTSVLFALERQLHLRGGKSIYIDCQNPSVYKSRWYELLSYIIDEIAAKYELEYEVINIKERYDERHAAKSFEEDISAIYKLLDCKRVLLIFDEIEHISFNTSESEYWNNGSDFRAFWQTIRSIYQKESKWFVFLIAGVNPLCIETPIISGIDNPVFGMLNPTYLELFGVKDVRDMISSIGKYMGLRFDEELYTKLTEDYGGHPFLIRHVCSLINKDASAERPCNVLKYDYSAKKDLYDNSIANYVELILSILGNWYQNEYRLLEMLVVDGNEEFKKNIDFSSKEINHLLGYGILKEVRGNYYITINAVTIYIEKLSKCKSKPTTKEEAWQKVSLRRNILEEKLRKIMVMQIAGQYGGKNVKRKIIEIIDSNKKVLLSEKTLDDLIINNLTLLDVKKVIMKNWKLFEKIFTDKNKFDIFMDIINKNRVDAHAKTISESDILMLQSAFNWFDEITEELMI